MDWPEKEQIDELIKAFNRIAESLDNVALAFEALAKSLPEIDRL